MRGMVREDINHGCGMFREDTTMAAGDSSVVPVIP